MRQFHVTVYAEVDDDGTIQGWDFCEIGAEPVHSDYRVYDDEAEDWERGELDLWEEVMNTLRQKLFAVGDSRNGV